METRTVPEAAAAVSRGDSVSGATCRLTFSPRFGGGSGSGSDAEVSGSWQRLPRPRRGPGHRSVRGRPGRWHRSASREATSSGFRTAATEDAIHGCDRSRRLRAGHGLDLGVVHLEPILVRLQCVVHCHLGKCHIGLADRPRPADAGDVTAISFQSLTASANAGVTQLRVAPTISPVNVFSFVIVIVPPIDQGSARSMFRHKTCSTAMARSAHCLDG